MQTIGNDFKMPKRLKDHLKLLRMKTTMMKLKTQWKISISDNMAIKIFWTTLPLQMLAKLEKIYLRGLKELTK